MAGKPSLRDAQVRKVYAETDARVARQDANRRETKAIREYITSLTKEDLAGLLADAARLSAAEASGEPTELPATG